MHFYVALFLPHTKSESETNNFITYPESLHINTYTAVKLHSAIASKQTSSS